MRPCDWPLGCQEWSRRTDYPPAAMAGSRGAPAKRIAVFALLLAVLAAGACASNPEDTETRSSLCFWFNRYIRELEKDAPDPEEVEKRALDLITAGLAYAKINDAPGIRNEMMNFARAMDAGDFQAIEAFINGMLGYCEDYPP